jgi:hypothetical protein
MVRPRKKKKRVRERRLPNAPRSTGSENTARWAQRISSALGLALLGAALAGSYFLPSLNRALGAYGNIALRVAGVGLIIASALFGRTQR